MPTKYTSGNSIKQELKDYNLSTLLPATTLDQIYNTYNDTSHQPADSLVGVDLLNYYTWQFFGSAEVLTNGVSSEGTYSLVVVRSSNQGTEADARRITLSPSASNQIICADGTFKSISDFISILPGNGISISNDDLSGAQVIALDVASSVDGSTGATTPIAFIPPAPDTSINTLGICLGGRMAQFGSALFNAHLTGDQVAVFGETGEVQFRGLDTITSNLTNGKGIVFSGDDGNQIALNDPSVLEGSGNTFRFDLPEGKGTQLQLFIPPKINQLAGLSSRGYVYLNGSSYTIQDIDASFPVAIDSSNQYFLVGLNGSLSETEYSNDASWGCSTSVYTQSGGLYQTSDATLKNFIDKVDIDFEKLATISKSKFYWKDDKTKHINIGVSAQEVQKVYPELVSKDNITGKLSVSYDKLSVIALAAIDKLNERLNDLEQKVQYLLGK